MGIMRLFAFSIFDTDVRTMPMPQYLFWTFLLFGVALAPMACVPENAIDGAFQLVLDLTGDIPTGFFSFVMPVALYMAAYKEDRSVLWYSGPPIAAMGFALTFYLSYVDLSKFVSACDSKGGCSSY